MTVNIYSMDDEVVKFKTADDKKMRTAKIRWNRYSEPFFRGFNGIKMMLNECVRTDSMWGDKEAQELGIVAQLAI